MFQRELVRDSQAETGPAGRKIASRFEAMKRSENCLYFFGRNSGAPVGDFDGDLFFITVQIDVDGFAIAMLYRVLQQILQDSLQRDRICEIHAGRVITMQLQLGPFELQVGSERFDHLPKIQLHRALAFNTLGELKELPYEAVHGVQVVLDPRDELGVGVFIEHLDRKSEAGQWRAKIV